MFMNLHLKMYNFQLLASFENSDSFTFVSFVQTNSDCTLDDIAVRI